MGRLYGKHSKIVAGRSELRSSSSIAVGLTVAVTDPFPSSSQYPP